MGNAAGLLVLTLVAAPPGAALEPLGRLSHPAIREASGIVKSRRHPGIFWVHNDSGNPPALFAVGRDGSLVREYLVKAPNIDWEDIATDDQGHLYLGEIGNNDQRLPLRAIYRVDEPDPSRAAKEPLPVTLASFYRFPSGQRFDAESLYIDHGRAIVIAKTTDRREAELFAIPLDPPAPLLKPARPEPVGRLAGFREPATGADLSADGRRLAVCANNVTCVYERTGDGHWKMRGEVFFEPRTVEAICWDGADLILADEERDLFRISESAWRHTARRPVER